METKRCAKCNTVKPLSDFNQGNRIGVTEWCEECRSAVRAYKQALKHRPQVIAEREARQQQKKRASAERARKRLEKFKLANPNYYRAAVQNSRSRRMNIQGEVKPDDIDTQIKSQRGLCWWCGKRFGEDYHVDHRVPLSRGGTNFPANLVIACAECNFDKNDKMPWEWIGRLL